MIRVWDAVTWKVLHDYVDSEPGVCRSIVFSADSRLLLSAIYRGGLIKGDRLIAFDTVTWGKNFGMGWNTGLPQWFYPSTLALSQDGKFVVIGGDITIPAHMSPLDGLVGASLLVVDIEKQEIVKKFPIDHTPSGTSFSVDGKTIATGSLFDVDGSNSDPAVVKIWSMETGQRVGAEPAQVTARIGGLRYTPDGRYLIASHLDGYTRFWDSKSLILKQEIKAQAASLAVSRDSHYLAMGGDGKIIVCELH
jgi:hypothetical protein